MKHMEKTQAPKRTTLDVMESQAKAELDFLNTTLKAKLRWIESAVGDIRRESEAGTLFPSTNLTKVAADVDMLYTRLKYATEALMTVETLKAEENK